MVHLEGGLTETEGASQMPVGPTPEAPIGSPMVGTY